MVSEMKAAAVNFNQLYLFLVHLCSSNHMHEYASGLKPSLHLLEGYT